MVFHFKSNHLAARLLNRLDTFIEFHCTKNGKQDLVKKIPIQDLKAWAHDLDMVVVMLEDPWKKQLVSLMCSINKINYGLALMIVEKRFFFKT
jgi:hypothetical protein